MPKPRWKYQDAAGREHIGFVVSTHDFGGTDVVYQYRDEKTGEVSVLSGQRLKAAQRIWED